MKANKNIILFLLAVIAIVILAYLISAQLIQRIDNSMPDFGNMDH